MSEPVRSLVSLADLRAAAATLEGVAVRTPLVPATDLADRFPEGVWLKPEMLQRTGAFKARGAFCWMSALDPERRARGVIAPSSGNHAQAVAWAARHYGVPSTVVMPETVTPAKKRGAERWGARVELCGRTTIERIARADEIARETGAVVVPPFDDDRIIAGQGTIGLEIVADLPDVATVIVPVGGGGLSSGVAAAVRQLRPSARIVLVEPADVPKYSAAQANGGPVTVPTVSALPDGLLGVRLGDRNWAHLSHFADECVAVRDADILAAMRWLLDRAKLVAEPSGAITLAALLSGQVRVTGPTAVVLSGGNIEWDGLRALLDGHGAEAGASPATDRQAPVTRSA